MFELIADDEIFMPCVGYEGHYSVSSYRRVFSHKNHCKTDFRELKPFINDDGYPQVRLSGEGGAHTIKIHVLVGEAFVGIRTNGLTYDHIDRNRSNNKIDNIRLATRCEQSWNQNIQKNNKTGERCISFLTIGCNNYYSVQIYRNNGFICYERLNVNDYTLEDAVNLRDECLEEFEGEDKK